MTTDVSPVSAGLRLRFSMGQLMALVGASAAVAALHAEMSRQAAAPSPWIGHLTADPAVLSASIVVAAIAVAGLRRSSATGMLLALAVSASSLALYGGLRHTQYAALGLPAFALLTVAVPLWIRRELGVDPPSRGGWARRLVVAGRIGLDSSMNLLGLVLLLFMFEAIGSVLPPPAPGGMITATFAGGPPVYPSASSVILTGSIAPPPAATVPMTPDLLPEFAPPPPEMDIECSPPGP
ncbi:MAG: hypothetical protein U0800_00090 [Isosphaeraceae bacterium]